MTNTTAKGYLFRITRAAFGLVLFSVGLQMTVQANIGLAPWDVLAMGVAGRVGVPFGTMTLLISISILLVDILLGAPIGVGTVLDTLIVGNVLNLLDALNIIPTMNGLLPGACMLIAGLFLMAFSQYLYMGAALCCGPRDSLLVALGRRMKRIPIGAVNIIIEVAVLAVGWLLGGPVGAGTLLSAAGIGVIMQIVFSLMRFEPRKTTHESFLDTYRVLKQAILPRSASANDMGKKS